MVTLSAEKGLPDYGTLSCAQDDGLIRTWRKPRGQGQIDGRRHLC
jgi:hypothetical protein